MKGKAAGRITGDPASGLGRWGREVEGSQTLDLTQRAERLRDEGKDVVVLAAGEPDGPPPPEGLEGVREALDEGRTGYTPAAGTPALRARVAEEWSRRLDRPLGAEQVMVTAGAKQACFNALAARLEEGDAVILPVPAWVTYRAQVAMLGGEPVAVPTRQENGFKLTREDLEGALTDRTRGIILNSPANPTGAVYEREDLDPLLEVVEEAGLWVVSDEIYDRITYDGIEALSPVRLRPSLFETSVVINGISKAYALTGFRIGFAVAAAPVIQAMTRIQGQISGNPNSTAQVAALRCLEGDQESARAMVRRFQARRDSCVRRLRRVPRLRFNEPRGAFYLFLDVSREMLRRSLSTDAEFCEALLEEEGLALVPGSAFGAPGFVRLSFAAAEQALDAAMDRFERFMTRD
jgi:aspartate aminotransferase